MQDMKNTRFIIVVALLLLPSTMMAQLQRSQDFKGKYQLKGGGSTESPQYPRPVVG